MQTFLLILSSFFLIISPVAYAVSIARGRSRPHRLTRLALMVALLLTFASAIAADANWGTLVLTGIMAAHGVVIFAMSLWRGMGGTSIFDWFCFGLAIAGLIGWQISGNALVGMWFAIFADIMAFIPAYVKTWKHPHTEGHWFYTLAIIGAFLSLVAYPLAATSAFQIYIIISCLAMILCIYHRQIFAKVDAVTPV